MRTYFSVFSRLGSVCVLTLLIAANLGLSQAVADDDDTGPTPPMFMFGSEDLPTDSWYVRSDVMALQRVFQGFGQAATLGTASTGSTALSQSSFNNPFQPGVEMLIGHKFDDSRYSVEVSYLYLTTFDTTAQAMSPSGQLDSPFTNFGLPINTAVDQNSLVQIQQISRMETGEVNFYQQLKLPEGDPQISLLFGVRQLGLDEEFDYNSTPTGNANPVTVHAHTNNNLWGPQIGGKICWGERGAFLQFDGKVGIFDNEFNRQLNASIGGVSATHPETSQSGMANVGDFKVSFIYRPTCALTATIGYRALWVDEVALASRNYITDVASLTNASVEPAINNRGTLFFHGPFAALQLSW
jgi:hypothetical protein